MATRMFCFCSSSRSVRSSICRVCCSNSSCSDSALWICSSGAASEGGAGALRRRGGAGDLAAQVFGPGHVCLRAGIGEGSDPFDRDLHHIAGLEELLAREPDAGGRAGEDQVAGLKRHPRREVRDLLGQREDHLARVGILLDHVVHRELDGDVLRVGHVVGRHDPWSERAGAVEAFLAEAIVLERRAVGDMRPLGEVARGEIVGDGIAGDVLKRVRDRDPIPGGASDPAVSSASQSTILE